MPQILAARRHLRNIKNSFTSLPKGLRLKNSELEVYVFLSEVANHKTQESWYWQKTIGARLGRAESTVQRACTTLYKRGLIDIRRTRNGNHYVLLDPKQNDVSDPPEKASRTRTEQKTGNTTSAIAPVVVEQPKKVRARSHMRKTSRHQRHTTIQRAVDAVLKGLDFAHSWALASAIEHAIHRWMRFHPGQGPMEAVGDLVGCWQNYQASGPHDYPCGPITFYQQNRWQNPGSWVQRRARDASSGIFSWKPDPEEETRRRTAEIERTRERLQTAASALEGSAIAAEPCQTAARILREMDPNEWLDLNERLVALEGQVSEAVVKAAPEDLVKDLREQAAGRDLKRYPMSDQTRREEDEKFLIRHLLEHYSLPRLSLLIV